MATDPKELLRLFAQIAAKPGKHLVTVGPNMPAAEVRAVRLAAQLGMEVKSASEVTKPDNGDKAVLVCIEVSDPLTLPDNKIKLCDWGCGRTVQFRPYHPDWIDKVCFHCVAERQEKDN